VSPDPTQAPLDPEAEPAASDRGMAVLGASAAVENHRVHPGAAHVPPTPQPAGRRRRLRRLATVGTILMAALVVGAIVLSGSSSRSPSRSATGLPLGYTAGTVSRRTLSESSTVDGTLGYGSQLEIYDRLSGTYTWLPSVGAVVGRGGTLFRVNNLPVVLMYGRVPAYRAMKLGITDGPDVAELNRNLIDLGYEATGEAGDIEAFSDAASAAVRRWQGAEGLAETGIVELGRVVFAPGARHVTALHVVLGQDPAGAEGSSEPTGHETPAEEQAAGEKSAQEKEASEKAAAGNVARERAARAKHPKRAPPKNAPTKEAPAKEAPAKEAPAKEAPAKEDPGKEAGEGGGGAGMAVLTTTSTQQLVELELKAEQQQLAHTGESVSVTIPGGGQVPGRITDVGTVAEAKESPGGEKGGSGGETPTISVTVNLDHPVARLDEAPVSVELVKSIRRGVLAVPATALTATGSGGYAIETLEGGRRSELPVTPGMFADGYVQIEGAGVREGLTVVEPQ
jgi:Putative peptidoglycan binding domain